MMSKFYYLAVCAFACLYPSVCKSALAVRDLEILPFSPYGMVVSYTVEGATRADIARGLLLSFENEYKTYHRYSTSEKMLENGKHTICWNMAKANVQSMITRGDFHVTVNYPSGSNSHACWIFITARMNYCVIDLSGGLNATNYPVSFLPEPPEDGFNREEFKTTKLVLKKVDPGEFTGTYTVKGNSVVCKTTLTRSFYMGLFEVTQKQWALVMGTDPSYTKGDSFPVDSVSYNDIRGSSKGSKWPSESTVDSASFLGRLRAKTGIDFDLPTEAQWELACRAGTTTAFSYGDEADGAYMWYSANSDLQTHEVGTRNPNPWGFYDMHGNVWEWCLDWFYASTASTETDPVGPTSGEYRCARGGSYKDASGTSSNRITNANPEKSYNVIGFRLVKSL